MKRLEEFADSVVKATQAYVARHFGPLAERIKAVEDWRASVPAARDGAPGKDADPELVRLMVTEAVSKIPPAKNGEDGAPGEIGENGAPGVDGKDADVDAIAQMVITKVTGVFDLIPLPKNGADGKDGAPGADGPTGAMGHDGQRGEKGEAGRDGKDGAPGADGPTGAMGHDGQRGEKGEAGRDGKDGIDGAPGVGFPGKDGMDGKDIDERIVMAEVTRLFDTMPKPKSITIEDVRPMLEAELSKWQLDFERRSVDTMAKAIDKMQIPKDGTPGRDGMSLDDFDAMVKEDGRTIVISLRAGDQVVTKELRLSVPVARGIYKAGAYEKDDVTTWGGSWWIALQDTTEPPGGESKHWKLTVKRGRDGKDAVAE
jgi:hypothetical protein